MFSFKSKEQKFWNWFIKNETKYYTEDISENNFDLLSSQLNKINKGLTYEFHPINEEGIKELSISADGIEENFPSVIGLIEVAPNIANFKFNAFRQRVPGDNMAITLGDINIAYDDIFFRYSVNNYKIGIELNIRNFKEEGRIKNAVYILLDGLLGEFDVTKEIDWIEWVKLDVDNITNLRPLIELRTLVDNNKLKKSSKL